MSVLPDELWRRILEIGVTGLSLGYKDLCCISISSRRLHRLSTEDVFWSALLSSDFPESHPPSSSNYTPSSSSSSSKSLYRIRFERDRARKRAAHHRAVLRLESQIAEHSRRAQEIELRSGEEVEKLKATIAELSNLQRVRQASVSLNVWQPDVIRDRQKQLVEQCVVPVESRINTLEMEIKLCRQLIAGLDKAHREEKRRLQKAKEQLASMNYHPLQDNKLTTIVVDEHNIKRKKLKKCVFEHEKQAKIL
ncbi:F-box protein SKIP24 isoform X2 [Malania oleifera]|uniref:F-box protein SKIP24 isoform X2 n=1 Tax=Malania oleifera TaxID=397392 RepID=UPI0025AE1686|nr:F-box protein SKIP24 isoform X2 [Malania oleifera]